MWHSWGDTKVISRSNKLGILKYENRIIATLSGYRVFVLLQTWAEKGHSKMSPSFHETSTKPALNFIKYPTSDCRWYLVSISLPIKMQSELILIYF